MKNLCGQADTFLDEVEFALPNTPERELFLRQELMGRMGEIEARAKECNVAVKVANTVPEREALPGQEEHIARIQQALHENDVCVRSALGQSFSKWLKEHPDQAQAYADLKSTRQDSAHEHIIQAPLGQNGAGGKVRPPEVQA